VWELRAILEHLYDHIFAAESLGAAHTGAKLDAYLIEAVDEDIGNLRQCVEEGDSIAIRDALEALELSAYKIAEAMYGNVDFGPASTSEPPPEGAAKLEP
jgi:hypothetical protein